MLKGDVLRPEHLLRFLLIGLCWVVGTCWVASVRSETITFANGTVLLEPPPGFLPLSDQVKAIKFPRGNTPTAVIGNESASTTIAYGLRPREIRQQDMEAARKVFTKVFSRVLPGLQFKENKVVDLAGQRWGYMEMTSNAVDTDIYNIVVFTGHQGKTLILNFNSTRGDFPKYEQALRKSISSLQLITK